MSNDEAPSVPARASGAGDADVAWTDLVRDMWDHLTGRGGAIRYDFVDLTVEVPQGPSDRSVWRLDGTVRITTSDT